MSAAWSWFADRRRATVFGPSTGSGTSRGVSSDLGAGDGGCGPRPFGGDFGDGGSDSIGVGGEASFLIGTADASSCSTLSRNCGSTSTGSPTTRIPASIFTVFGGRQLSLSQIRT